jgi:hypothetical protein
MRSWGTRSQRCVREKRGPYSPRMGQDLVQHSTEAMEEARQSPR